MDELNEVLTASKLRVGDRIILKDGHADVLGIIETNPHSTIIRLLIDDTEDEEVLVPEAIWLEVQRAA